MLVRRGDRDVARSVADNRGARLSEAEFLPAGQARRDRRHFLPRKSGCGRISRRKCFGELLTKATAVVHKRLLASAPPELKADIHRVLDKVSSEVGERVGPRDYRAAQRVVLSLHRAGAMDEAALAAFAGDGKYEETVVALAALTKVPINVADRLMASERPDPVLILCKAARLELVDGEVHHRGAAGWQGGIKPGRRFRIRQLRTAFGLDGATRGAILAGRRRDRLRFFGKSENTRRALPAPPWRGNASR